MADKDYAREWYNYGRATKDPIVKFMMHWIAFNWLYRECRQDDEKTNIELYCDEHYDRLSRYNPFVTTDIDAFDEGAIVDERTSEKQEGLYNGIFSRNARTRMRCLLLSIYQVRCNLFHGSKRLYLDRDKRLVESSANIMEKYLGTVLEDDVLFF